MDKEKVIKGLEHCIAEGKDCRGCIYYEQMINEKESCACRSDALDVIRDLQSQIAMLVVAQHELCELLKEQEEKPLRCDKCSYHREDGWCGMHGRWVTETDYCSFGAWEGR